MNELIPIRQEKVHGEEILTVDARQLWGTLEVKDKFADWIVCQIKRGRFVEDRDFVVFRDKPKNPENTASGGRPTTEYHLTLDTAKHVAMMSNTDKGHEVRDYFIECENRLKKLQPQFQIPKTFAEALRLAANQQEQIEVLKPKAEFFDAVTGSNDAVDMGTVAKVLNMGIGRNELFEFLRDQNILMQDNKPYQKYVDAGYFRLIEQKYNKTDGSVHISFKTVIFQKGIDYIRRKLEETRMLEAA